VLLETKLKDYLDTHCLCVGRGNEQSCCSIAAINLIRENILTDRLPPDLPYVISAWIIGIQDSMPDELRNSKEWKDTLVEFLDCKSSSKAVEILTEWLFDKIIPEIFGNAFKRCWNLNQLPERNYKQEETKKLLLEMKDASKLQFVYKLNLIIRNYCNANRMFWKRVDPCSVFQKLVRS
jgi:hypothetical protein